MAQPKALIATPRGMTASKGVSNLFPNVIATAVLFVISGIVKTVMYDTFINT